MDGIVETGRKGHGWPFQSRHNRMLCRDGPVGAAPAMACPEGASVGVPFFGTFLWASKERYSPACDAGRSKYAA